MTKTQPRIVTLRSSTLVAWHDRSIESIEALKAVSERHDLTFNSTANSTTFYHKGAAVAFVPFEDVTLLAAEDGKMVLVNFPVEHGEKVIVRPSSVEGHVLVSTEESKRSTRVRMDDFEAMFA